MQQESLVAIGRLVKPHGVKGEIVFLPYVYDLTLLPELRAQQVVLRHDTTPPQSRTISAWRPFNKRLLVRFADCQDMTQAALLRDYEVLIARHRFAPLPAGEYYWFEIEGLAVYADTGRYLGNIVEIIYTGSNDVYVVRQGAEEILVPALQDVVRTIDTQRGEVHLFATPGLLD